MAPLSNFLEKYSMQRIVCLFPLHTLTLHRLLVLHQSTCFLINYFRDASYQNQAARSLPPPNGHLQAGLRKRKMQYPLFSWKIFFFLQKREICEEQHWHQIKDFFPRKSEDDIHRALHVWRTMPVSYLISPSCPLSAKSFGLPLV